MVTSTIYSASAQWYLYEGGEGVELGDGAHGVNETTLVCECSIATNEWLSCNSCLIRLNTKYILDDFFGGRVDLWVHESNMVVACNDITESRESFFNSLDSYALR